MTQVYFQVWFEAKVKHSIVDGPHHIITLLRLVRQQSEEVREIVTPYIQSGAWFAHPEAMLVSLLASPTQTDREFAVEQILKVRGDSDMGDMRRRDRVTPYLRMEATTLSGMIDWEKDTVHEPVFSCSLTKAQLREVVDKPMVIPYYPIHTQSTERAVKQVLLNKSSMLVTNLNIYLQVTEAAAAVCGPEKRDGYVRARVAHREVMPKFQSKQDLKKFFQF